MLVVGLFCSFHHKRIALVLPEGTWFTKGSKNIGKYLRFLDVSSSSIAATMRNMKAPRNEIFLVVVS